MKSHVLGVVLLGVALLAGQARASIITINFDNLGGFVTVTNQYPSVTFSADGGDVVLTVAQAPPYQSSQPNLICTGPVGGPADCTADITLAFTNPVDNLSFGAYGNITAFGGTFAKADVYQGGASPSQANIPLTVKHTKADDTAANCPPTAADCVSDPQSLNFTGITKVVIHGNSDNNGTAYDDFSFSTIASVTTDAPEPSTLLLTGLCGIVWTGRRFLARKSR